MTTNYKIKVNSLIERKKHIKEFDGIARKEQYSVDFQGSYQGFPVHDVPIDFPIYRLENGRTKAAQKEYIVKNGSNEKLFDDPESIDAQIAQHEILEKMVDQEELRKHFEKEEQTESLVLDNKGVVINGNRRLCAMRELMAEDSNEYDHFSHVKVIFLPPSSAQDIFELESKLQLHKDIKAKYSWIAEAFQLKDSREKMKLDDSTLMKRFAKKSRKEVQDTIDKIYLVDNYLESRDKKCQYSLLEKSEYAFTELQKYLKKINQPAIRGTFTQSVFSLIDQTLAGTKTDRVYQGVKDLYNCRENHHRRVTKEFSDDIKNISDENPLYNDDSSLLGEEGDNNQNEILQKVISSDDETRKKLGDIANESITVYKENLSVQDQKTRSITLLQKANSLFDESISALDGDPDKEAIKKQLDCIDENLEQIRDWLRNNEC